MDESDTMESMAGLPEGLSLQDVPAHVSGPDFPVSRDISTDKLLEMLEQFKSLSSEDKASLMKDLPGIIAQPPSIWQSFLNSQVLTFLLLLLMVVGIFVLIGYKIYISQVEKERKREEKRQLKQMKKRK